MEAIIAILLYLGVITSSEQGNQNVIQQNKNGLNTAKEKANEIGVNAIIGIDDLTF